jgi:hypothetical protein
MRIGEPDGFHISIFIKMRRVENTNFCFSCILHHIFYEIVI